MKGVNVVQMCNEVGERVQVCNEGVSVVEMCNEGGERGGGVQ